MQFKKLYIAGDTSLAGITHAIIDTDTTRRKVLAQNQ
jgi:hypothetical protein